ncbi:MAG: hypothetical protein NTX50_06650 [Candidatus Sumerlaeota bacterium]|nr:hypothetical protein [Candidatus Sumerlaeota bacterium]
MNCCLRDFYLLGGYRHWLYVVFNCVAKPDLHPIQDPARLGWEPLIKIEHYHVDAGKILREGQ